MKKKKTHSLILQQAYYKQYKNMIYRYILLKFLKEYLNDIVCIKILNFNY